MPTPIQVLSHDVVMERVESGLIIPMDAGEGLRVVDCGDDRGLTADYYDMRVQALGTEASPGRYYGASSGIALGALSTFAAEHGDQAVTEFVEDFSPEGFVNFASDLSDRAHGLEQSVELNQHSAEGNEQNPIELADHKHCNNPLGCAFATFMGAVMHEAAQARQIEEAHDILSAAGTDLPIREAAEGLAIMRRHIPEDFGIHRGALHFAQTKSGLHTPVAIHEGKHAPNEKTALVVDLAGYRSNANRHVESGLPRYHHTPGLASELMPRLMPEVRLDPRLLEATGMLLGASTRLALSGAENPDSLRVEVIPPEYAAVA